MPQKTGTVYISFVDDAELDGHWESLDGEVLESGPGWADVDDAIAWGGQRAPVVLVRVGDKWYSAGEVPDMGDVADSTPYPRWPPRPTGQPDIANP